MKKRMKQFFALTLSLAVLMGAVPEYAMALPAADQNDTEYEVSEVEDEEVEVEEDESLTEEVTDKSVQSEKTSEEREEIKSEIFKSIFFDQSTSIVDLSSYNLKQEEAIELTGEVLEENHATDKVQVAYVSDEENNAVMLDAEVDPVLSAVAKDIDELADGDGGEGSQEGKIPMTEEEKQQILQMYAEYQQYIEANPDYFGIQAPFFTTKDTETSPLGSLLLFAGWTQEQVDSGEVSFDDLQGMLGLFMIGNQLAVQMYGEQLLQVKDQALSHISDDMSTIEKMLVLNDWLANWSTFDMAYIMNKGKSEEEKVVVAEEPVQSEFEQQVAGALIHMFQEQGDSEDVAQQKAQFMTPEIIGMYKGNHFGALVMKEALCVGYSNAYLYLLQWACPEIYKNEDGSSWKTKDELNYVTVEEQVVDEDGNVVMVDVLDEKGNVVMEDVLDEAGNPVMEGVVDEEGNPVMEDVLGEDGKPVYETDEEGNPIQAKDENGEPLFEKDEEGNQVPVYVVKQQQKQQQKQQKKQQAKKEPQTKEVKQWSADAPYMVDYVMINFKTSVTMYGEEDPEFASVHYWNAVKVDGQWYYVDPCYTDIYITCMSRDRVETDGNMNHLYFMISDTSMRQLYKDNFESIVTLYEDIATDKTYEKAWFAYAKSPVSVNGDDWYYYYDSTDVIEQWGSMGSGDSMGDMSGEGYEDDTEYKLVVHDGSLADDDATFKTLVDFNNGQVLNASGEMEDNALIQELYAQYEKEREIYPSIAISGSYYNGKFYFNISNCILTYDVATGEVEKLKEYNTVSAHRDRSVALGGTAFSIVANDSEDADQTVQNHPLASLAIKDDGNMYVSVATNYAFISGKESLSDKTSYGYEFEETNYNPEYNRFIQDMGYGDEINDNDEFMWSANFVETLEMSHVTGSSHTYEPVVVAPSCERAGFTENRCTTCGISEGTETTDPTEAIGHHHYLHVNEVYYTKDDTDNWNTGEAYVCTECLTSKEELEEGESVTDHTYVDPTFAWSEDSNSCTATASCSVCTAHKLDCTAQEEEGAFDKTVDCAISKDYGEDYDCTKGGIAKFTATADFNGTKFTESKDVEIPAGQHVEKEDTEYTDNEDGTHTYHCIACDKDITENCAFDENHACPKCDSREKGYGAQAVADLKAVPAGKQKVKLTWTASPDADGYLVYGISEKNGKYGYITMVEGRDKTTAYDTKAYDEEYNFYWVFPYSLSPSGAKRTGPCPEYVYAKGVTPAVTGLKAASEAKGVQLTWNKSVDAEGYLIYGIHPGKEYGYIGMTEKLTYLDTAAPADEYSYYWVYPYHKKDGNRIAGPACAKYVYGKANGTTISNLKATAMKGAIKLTWNDSRKPDGYLIYVREGDGEYTFRAKTTSSDTTYVDKKASTEVRTFYWVYGYTNNEDGSMNVGPRSHYTYGTALK